MRVRCPDCDRGFAVENDAIRASADCPACGESVPLPRDRESDREEPRRRRLAEGEGRRLDEYGGRPRRRWEDDEKDRARRRAERRDEEYDDWPARPRKRRPASLGTGVKVFLFACPVLLVLFGVLAVGLLWQPPFRPDLFRPHLPVYTAFSFRAAPAGTPVGKMVVVNLGTGNFDELMDFLPPSVRAASPEEVTTVAQLRWNKKQVGTYTGGTPAHEWSCDVTVLDLRSGGAITSEHIAGSRAPNSVRISRTRSTPTEGHKPTGEVVEYLKRLGRR